ncbi:MAG: hypothetical protein ABI980_14280 [Nitrospirota bacterium]
MRALIGLLAILLAACAQTTLLVKDGLTPQQFESDKLDCEHAQKGSLVREDFLRCMKTKGYREATPNEYKKARSAPASMVY